MKLKSVVKHSSSRGGTTLRKKQAAQHLVSRSEIRNLFSFLKLCKKVDNTSSQPFKNASISDINTLVKIIKLVLRERLPIRKDRLKKLKKYKSIFRKLVHTHSKDNLVKRRLINQTGSGLLSLLPIIGGVLSSIFSR